MPRRLVASTIYEFYTPYPAIKPGDRPGYASNNEVLTCNSDGLNVDHYYDNYDLPDTPKFQRLFQWVFPLPFMFAHMRKVPALSMEDVIALTGDCYASERFSSCFWHYHDRIEESGPKRMSAEITSGRLLRALRSSGVIFNNDRDRSQSLFRLAESRARRLYRTGAHPWPHGLLHEQQFFEDWRAAVGMSY